MINKKKWLIFCFAILGLFVLHTNSLHAQTQPPLSIQNISTIKIDELNDDQIAEFWLKMQENGLSLTQLETEAKRRNMPTEEFLKLKERINNLPTKNTDKTTNNKDRKNSESTDEKENDKIVTPKIKTFGYELFNNKNLTFEPNLKIATPQNYQLGPDDELIIDIYGYSEESFKLKVSPDGNIRIPLVGIIQVSGLTIEQARIRIKSSLSSVYDRINTGETKVNITLGNIRSIKVLIVGEANLPGTYTLPSLATVFNALYVSGGPNNNGSMRNIKVIRNNKVVAMLDIYDFMLNAEAKGNIRLQDQDIIKISPYENKVEIKGEVKREGYFEITKNETLRDLLHFAGGFTNDAYRERIKVIRNTDKEKSVADIEKGIFSMFSPKSGDVYTIDKLLERYENRVQIKGAVFRPGTYALEKGLTIMKLINKAEGLKEDAFLTRAIVYRLNDDNSLSMLSINLEEAQAGKTADLELKREDIIQIASKLDLKESFNVTISGQVIKPGVFPFAQNMKIEDLIIAAGGLKEDAAITRVEVARRKFDIDKTQKNAEIATIKQFELNKDLKDNENLNFVLEPFDIVTIFKLPGYESQQNVSIEGEVLYPGSYTIQKNSEKISDLFNRCGGVTATAGINGVILLRKKIQSETENYIKINKIKALKRQSKDTSDIQDKIEEDNEVEFDIVGINIPEILKKPGSKGDLLLRDGDVIKVPFKRQTVLVTGEVLYPARVNVGNANRLRKFVQNAGGFSSKALKRKAYVVYANGTVKATKNFLFVKFYPKIKPGCEIVIPKKDAKKPVSLVEITTVATSLTTLVFLIITISK